MKKYLLILTAVLVFSSVVSAASVDLQIISGPDPQGTDPCSGAPSYLPGDTVTIGLVGSGFDNSGADPWNAWCGLTIGTATTNNGGTASTPQLHSKFSGTPGTIVNSGGILIANVDGIVGMGDFVGIPNGEVGWWFDYHIPDVPASTIIAIDLTGLVIRDAFGGTMSVTYGGALEIHVAELPCCPGDTGNSGAIDISDYNKIKGQLSMAGFFNNGVYYIAPGDPNTGFLWPCN